MMAKHELVAADILPAAEYARHRAEHRRRVGEQKRNRRVEVGPYVTFYFESYDTMWLQVQEMVHIEKGGTEQVPDELAAYNPLVPKGDELVATFMIEIDDPARRQRILAGLGGIEETAFLRVAGEAITAAPEADQDRTTAEGKASSVQFVHFRFTPAQIAAFRKPGTEVVIGFTHEQYRHMAVMAEAARAALAADFD
jgi:Protein of unknown function (DUF3501)